ncbi:MAG: purine-nucleoside phosphorylase, partial [Parafilimonas sp.]
MEAFIQTKGFLIKNGITKPSVGIVLGTGLHQLLNYVDVEQTIAYADIPNFPVSTVESHKGNLIYGNI